jgi:hypothetical protein
MGFQNKGGIAVRLRVFDSYVTFIDCHLASGDEMLVRRNQEVEEIGRIMFKGIRDPWTPRLRDGETREGVSLFDAGMILILRVRLCDLARRPKLPS